MVYPLPWGKTEKDRFQKNTLLILQWESTWGSKSADTVFMPLSWGGSLWRAIAPVLQKTCLLSPVNSSWLTPPKTSMLVKCMLNSGLTEIRGEHPAETMSRTSGNKIWRTVCTNRSGYLVRSWVGGTQGRGWNSTSKLSRLSLLFNTKQVEAGHTGQKSVSAQSDYARQLAFSFRFVNFTEPHQNKLKMILLSGLGYKKYKEIRK